MMPFKDRLSAERSPDKNSKVHESPYRVDELVWVRLDEKTRPLPSRLWPGIITKRSFQSKKIQVVEFIEGENSDMTELPETIESEIIIQLSDSEDGKTKTRTMKRTVQRIQVVDFSRWDIQLLALSDMVGKTDSEIIPWLGYQINPDEWKTVKTEQLSVPNYLLIPEAQPPHLIGMDNPEKARLFFQLALQTAAEIEEQYALGSIKICPSGLTVKDNTQTTSHQTISAKGSESMNDSRLPQREFISDYFWYDHIWLGAEKITIKDMVRLAPLKLLLYRHHKPVCDNEDIISNLFLHVSHLYAPKSKKNIVLVGSVYELISTDLHTKRPKLNSTRHASVKRVLEKLIIPELNIQDQRLENGLPSSPRGYIFKLLTPPTKVNALEWNCIAGRYYAPLWMNPSACLSKNELGLEHIMRTITFCQSREEIFKAAEKASKEMMAACFQKTKIKAQVNH